MEADGGKSRSKLSPEWTTSSWPIPVKNDKNVVYSEQKTKARGDKNHWNRLCKTGEVAQNAN